LPFLPLFDFAAASSSSQMPHSSRFAARSHLTLRFLGGKSGKIAARMWQDAARGMAKTAMLRGGVAVSTASCERLALGG
jgi:hypothetical protein